MKKRKIGFFLILIGIAIPSVMFFFTEHELLSYRSFKTVSRRLTPAEFEEMKTKYREKQMDEGTSEFGKFITEYFFEHELSEKDKWITKKWILEDSKINIFRYRCFIKFYRDWIYYFFILSENKRMRQRDPDNQAPVLINDAM